MTKEIGQKHWEDFCRRINDAGQGTMVSIHIVEQNGRTTSLANDVPLHGVTFKKHAGECSDELIVEAGSPGERPIQHTVVEPIHIRLKDAPDQRFNHLHILAENGTTIIAFHPGLTPALVQDFEAH
jgi:hypothetical protein